MNCMDLFVAAAAIGLGFEFAKEFFRSLLAWADKFDENWKNPRFILWGIFLLLIFFYLSYAMSSLQFF